MLRQLLRAIDKLSPNKPQGPDEIPKAIIKKTFDTTQQYLLAMAHASINLAHFPTCFNLKATTTIVLRKPQKPDYTKASAYLPTHRSGNYTWQNTGKRAHGPAELSHRNPHLAHTPLRRKAWENRRRCNGDTLGKDTHGVERKGQTDKENAIRLQRLLEGAEQWREKHVARFETSKYVLVHFTRRRAAETTTPIQIANTIIQPSQQAKYLGVIFDKKLRVKFHIQHATKRGSKFSHAMSRIAKSTSGTTYQETRRLFTSVVALRIAYAAI